MQAKEYYKILGVSESATPEEIKRAYRKIARESHPDRNPGYKAAEERFKEASEAYDILGDPAKKEKYDALRKYGFDRAGFGGQGFPGGFGGQGQGFPGGFRVRYQTSGSGFENADFADIFAEGSPFTSIFEQIFQQMGGGPGPRVARNGHGRRAAEPELDDFFRADGSDVHCTVWLKLEQLERGAKVKVKTPSGRKVLIRVPPGTKIGSVLRIPGMGLARHGRTGDQYVHVEAVA